MTELQLPSFREKSLSLRYLVYQFTKNDREPAILLLQQSWVFRFNVNPRIWIVSKPLPKGPLVSTPLLRQTYCSGSLESWSDISSFDSIPTVGLSSYPTISQSVLFILHTQQLFLSYTKQRHKVWIIFHLLQILSWTWLWMWDFLPFRESNS